jgi:hypothetical protein
MKITRLSAIRLTLVATLLSLAAACTNAGFVPGRVLVRFRSDLSKSHQENIVRAFGGRLGEAIPHTGVRVISVPRNASVEAVARAFAARSEVVFAEPDLRVPPDAVPNDPLYSREWHLGAISAPTAWDISTGSPNVIIAILDSGVYAGHPDLAAKMVPGWNTYDNNADTSDVYGHGTAVAGCAAASTQNAEGVASVAWGCRIMPMRVTDTSGYGYSSAISAALTWAADHGARVANISFKMSTSTTVKTAAQYFASKGGVVCVSAGNDATFTTAADNPYVLTVTASQSDDTLATFTSTGNNTDLAAPGVSIYTTNRSGGYSSGSGTSFSAPIVAGAAALVISVAPHLSSSEVMDVLKRNADDLGPAGWDAGWGAGRLNIARALQSLGTTADTQAPALDFLSPVSDATVQGPVTVQVAASDDRGVASVSLEVDGTLLGTDREMPFEFNWNAASVSEGLHTLTATARDAAGNAASRSIVVRVSIPDTIPPTVSIVSPKRGAKVSGVTRVSLKATDNVKVTSVSIYVDADIVATLCESPWRWDWDTTTAGVGYHTLRVVARDAWGNTAEAGTWVTVTAGASQPASVSVP